MNTTMSFYVLRKNDFSSWIDRLVERYQVIGPKATSDGIVFDKVHSGEEVLMDYPTTILPPKKVLLPQRERLFQFGGNGRQIKPDLATEHSVIMGIHTCDMHAIALLDEIFSQGYPDQHYLARREHTSLISIECLEPCSDQSFCKDMGTHILPEQYDLHLTDIGEAYTADIGSEKGTRLLMLAEVQKITDLDYEHFSKTIGEKWGHFPYRLKAEVTALPSLLSASYNGVHWDEAGERCLGCGNCTAVCPTCCCFDVKDEVDFTLKSGERYRVWDSCQLNEYALVAGGHDFRANRGERLRHRFIHKFKTQGKDFGMLGCVGCGRCTQACLVNISPVDLINKIHQQRTAAVKQHRR